MTGCTALALSQSGRTPDVVDYLRLARARGAYTVAITNDATSELAAAAEAVLPLCAGSSGQSPRRRPTRTRSPRSGCWLRTAQTTGRASRRSCVATANLMSQLVPATQERITSVAVPFAFAGRMFVDRPRCRVRNSPRDRAQAARDLPRRGRAVDRDRPRARTGRGARPDVPGVGDRLGRRDAAGGARSGSPCACNRRDGDCERQRGRGRVGAAYSLPVPIPRQVAPDAAALRRAGSALRVGARADEGPGPRRAARALEGHARSLSSGRVRLQLEPDLVPPTPGQAEA